MLWKWDLEIAVCIFNEFRHNIVELLSFRWFHAYESEKSSRINSNRLHLNQNKQTYSALYTPAKQSNVHNCVNSSPLRVVYYVSASLHHAHIFLTDCVAHHTIPYPMLMYAWVRTCKTVLYSAPYIPYTFDVERARRFQSLLLSLYRFCSGRYFPLNSTHLFLSNLVSFASLYTCIIINTLSHICQCEKKIDKRRNAMFHTREVKNISE